MTLWTGILFESTLVDISTDQSLAVDFVSQPLEIWGFDCGSITYLWTGADATTAKVIPQMSNDKVNYCDYISEADANRVDKPAGDGSYEIQKFCFKWMRIRVLHKTNTTGTITISAFAKRQRISA